MPTQPESGDSDRKYNKAKREILGLVGDLLSEYSTELIDGFQNVLTGPVDPGEYYRKRDEAIWDWYGEMATALGGFLSKPNVASGYEAIATAWKGPREVPRPPEVKIDPTPMQELEAAKKELLEVSESWRIADRLFKDGVIDPELMRDENERLRDAIIDFRDSVKNLKESEGETNSQGIDFSPVDGLDYSPVPPIDDQALDGESPELFIHSTRTSKYNGSDAGGTTREGEILLASNDPMAGWDQLFSNNNGDNSEAGDGAEDPLAAAAEKSVMEQELLAQDLEAKQAIRDEYAEKELSALQDKNDKILENEQKKNDAEKKLDLIAVSKKVAGQIQAGQQLLGAVGGNSKKMFNLKKKLAMAEALVSLPSAVVQAIKNAGGMPWGALPAAATIAAGIAQINAIRSQKFDGGEGGGSAAAAPGMGGGGAGGAEASGPGGSPNIPSLDGGSGGASRGPARKIDVVVRGKVFDPTAIRELIEGINEEIGDGADLKVSVS